MESKRHCKDCGAQGPFPDDKVLRCKACIDRAAERRKVFTRLYHRARSRAVSRTVEAHKDQFDSYMDEELAKVAKEEDAIEFVRAARQSEPGQLVS